MKQWLEANHLTALGHTKFSHMMSHFDSHILSGILPYFLPLKDHIKNFWKALIPERESMASDGKWVVHSTATAEDIINVFKAVLQDKKLILAHRSVLSSVLGKRSVPGDLIVGSNGWDPVKAPKNLRTASPKLSPHCTQKTNSW
jgi:hypothetical protein